MGVETSQIIPSVCESGDAKQSKGAVESFFNTVVPPDFEIDMSDTAEVKLHDSVGLKDLMLERPPFYFISCAVSIDRQIVWAVADMSEERSAGHFPERPIVPLIELCKAIAQTGIVLVSLHGSENGETAIAISAGPSKALAKELISAPARIVIRAELARVRLRLFVVDGIAFCNGERIGSLERITYTLMNHEEVLQSG